MKKNDFIEKFPDVMALHIETDTVLSRQAKEDKVLIICNTFQSGLIAYKSHGRNIDIFVSKKMKEELSSKVQELSTEMYKNTEAQGTPKAEEAPKAEQASKTEDKKDEPTTPEDPVEGEVVK